MKEQINGEESERWENYRIANSRFPHVRQKELSRQLELTNPQKGETILEVGTGNGYLTFALAEAVGENGRVITYDYQKSNLDFVEATNQGRFPITTVHQSLESTIDLPDESIDKVSTIATLHHYDDRSLNTGTSGRERILKEFYRVLKVGGYLMIGDVAHGTAPQRYFDAINNPRYCHPRGHPHDFLDEDLARKLCSEIGFCGPGGFARIWFNVESVPWIFNSEEQAKEFLHTIHNAQCAPEESLEVAKKYLNYEDVNGEKELGWELFYLFATKAWGDFGAFTMTLDKHSVW